MPGYHWLPDALQEPLLDRQGRRDARRLLRREPGLEAALRAAGGAGRRPEGAVDGRGRARGAGDGGAGPDGGDRTARAYEAYLRRPEPDAVMAASLPFARFLRAWCDAREPTRIVDLGSGFTSWVIRDWARDRRVDRVVSVDDDPGWLEVSRNFVRDRGLPDGNFVRWEEFRWGAGRFDLVVWDFSGVRRRASATRSAAGRVAPGGALLFDDIHKARLWHRARWLDWLGPAEGYSLRAFTMDGYGRYAWLGLF